MQLNIVDESKPEVKSVAIITPTIGTKHLARCVKSVKDQTFKETYHYVVVDGGEFADRAHFVTLDSVHNNFFWCCLPENVGKAGGNWYGHRVYAAFSYLVNADAVIFLDEDNWIEKDHVESLVKTINENNLDWSWSFRQIFDKEGNYLVHDNCESLGVHPAWVGDNVFHIDTSSYCVRREVATRVAGAWFGQWGADRQYFGVIAEHFPNALPSKKHSLCYRLDGNPNSVNAEFFEKGNAEMHKRYGDNLPWLL